MTDALTIYDVTIDEERTATQEDVDRLVLASQVFGRASIAHRHLDSLAHRVLAGKLDPQVFFAALNAMAGTADAPTAKEV